MNSPVWEPLERHGMYQTKEYRAWKDMKSRCQNPNHKMYQYYGGKGVTVCDRWQKFSNFYADLGPAPAGSSLGRKGDAGNYEPGNVKWEMWNDYEWRNEARVT